jgi:hypothetical protein
LETFPSKGRSGQIGQKSSRQAVIKSLILNGLQHVVSGLRFYAAFVKLFGPFGHEARMVKFLWPKDIA